MNGWVGERFRAPGFAGSRGGNPHAVMANTSETLRRASEQLTELTGMEAESVSSFQRTEDGWTLTVEVLELARVPDTMSLLASYEVQVDQEGELVGYRRVRRYERGRADRSR
ncbi:gas vesicle protein [Streptomyces sp. NRRL S-118]|uniref:gas vesicle protein GvpO n=2 Tax=unclassified Streptomyces TaxID=2593676 RepID=UPI003B63C8BC